MSAKGNNAAMFVDLSTELLGQGHRVRFRAEGTSMLPTIQDGDRVTVGPVDPDAVQPGDIILCLQRQRPIVHRVAQVRTDGEGGTTVVARGDGKAADDAPIATTQILGRVVAIEPRTDTLRTGVGRAAARYMNWAFHMMGHGKRSMAMRLPRVAAFLFTLVLLIGATASSAEAAVAVDAATSSSGNVSSLSFSLTVGAGSNRLLLVGVSTTANSAVSGVTYNAVALARVSRVANTGSVELWRLVAPPSGTFNVIVSLTSGNVIAGAVSFTGVDQGAPLGATVVATGTSTAPSVTLSTVRTGDFVMDTIVSQDTVIGTVGGSQTSRWNTVQSKLGAGSTRAGAGSPITMSWTTNSFAWASIGTVIRATGSDDGAFLTGSYTGNATDNTVIGEMGFEPEAVFVKGDSTLQGVFRTSTMNGDASKLAGTNTATTGTALTAGLVKSLDGAGSTYLGSFTIGTGTATNTNLVNYYWAALRAKAGQVFIGSYMGTGVAQTITGVGFQPDYVWVMGESTSVPVQKSSTMASTTSVQFNAVASSTAWITAIAADGFSVGTNARTNSSAVTYHYVAWKITASFVAIGSYTGNGGASQSVTGLGFQPEFVQSRITTATNPRFKSGATGPAVTTTTCVFSDASACSIVTSITSLDAGGFTVGVSQNASGVVYHYMAFGRSAPATAVRLASFSAARAGAAGTLLKWRTGYEVDNLGFNVYREESGVRTRITPSLVGGSGLLVAKGTKTGAGHAYQWLDQQATDPNAKVTYLLEDVDLNGTKTLHGPIAPVSGPAIAPGNDARQSELLERLSKSSNQNAHAASDRSRRAVTELKARAKQDAPSGAASESAAPPAVLSATTVSALASTASALAAQQTIAAGSAVKLSVKSEGWYRATQPQLVAAGLPPSVSARSLRLFVDGAEQPMVVVGATADRFEAAGAIEFYGAGADTPFADTRVYWLTAGQGAGRGMASVPAGPPGVATVASFPYTVEVKDRSTFFGALINGDAGNYFGAVITPDPTDLTVAVTHLDIASSGAAMLEVTLQGVTDSLTLNPDHRVAVLVNGTSVGQMVFDGQAHPVQTFAVPSATLVEGSNTVTLVALGDASDVSLVDVVRLTYAHTYRADAGRLRFTAVGQQFVSVGGFTRLPLRVIDITDPNNVFKVVFRTVASGGAYEVSFQAPGTGTRTLMAFSNADASPPASIRANRPSSWHLAGLAADYVLVSPGEFADAVGPLMTLRQGQGHSTALVDIEDVYDEFSFGQKTPYALRDFLIRAKAAWSVPPRFVTLVGNASNDPRDYLGIGEADWVPTKTVATKILETASDDWFVDINGDGIPELAAIGRVPARTVAQAASMVNKIVAYEQADSGPWAQAATLVADAPDPGDADFGAEIAHVHTLLPAEYVVTEIRRGSVGTAAARTALFDLINQGQGIVNYTGHGSVQIWRDNLLTDVDPPTFTNGTRLPLFVIMNCLNGFFQGLFPEESLAEALVRAGSGGAIAVWASSGLTEPVDQLAMNTSFYNLLFQGTFATIGETVAAAKGATRNLDVRRTWIFFGDPAMKLKGVPTPAPTLPALAANVPIAPAGTAPSRSENADLAALASGASSTVRLQDWNGDGRADVFLTASDSWRAALTTPGGEQIRSGLWDASWDVYPANLNGDGASDLVLFDRHTGTWAQAVNDGSANFTYTYGTWGTEWAVHIADLNGDGFDDVLLTDALTGLWFSGLNTHHGSFTYRSGQWATSSTITIGDFNGDGRADAFLYNRETGAWTLAQSDREGGFSNVAGRWAAGWTVQVANLNADGRADLLLYNPDTGAWAECAARGSGQFDVRGGAWNAGLTVRVIDARAKGHDRDDILLYDRNTGRWAMSVYRGGVPSVSTGVWLPRLTIATGDLDGDGRTDLVLYDRATGEWIRGFRRASGRVEYTSGQWGPGWTVAGRP